MSDSFVYVLIDPRDDTIFYVGQTSRGKIEPEGYTKKGHRRLQRSRLYSKLKKLHKLGVEARWEIWEETEVSDLDSLEVFTIANLRAAGAKLTNFADGGRSGNRGVKHSVQARANVSAGTREAMARPEIRAKIDSAERKENWRSKNVGRKRSDSTRKSQSGAALIAQNKTEQRELLRAMAKAQWADPVQRSKKLEGLRLARKRKATIPNILKTDSHDSTLEDDAIIGSSPTRDF